MTDTIRTERGLNKNSVVQLLDIGSNTECRHGVKHTQRVTPFNEFVRVPLMQSARYEENNVVDHV